MSDPLSWDFWTQDTEGIRNLIWSVGLGVAVTVGTYLAFVRTMAANRSSKAADSQARTASKSHITEAFTKAIGQLGSDRIEVRLGAIYALERITKEDPEYYWPIIQTLTAYVRERKLYTADNTPKIAKIAKVRLEVDIQGVLAVLGRRHLEHENPDQIPNLSDTNLGGLILEQGEHRLGRINFRMTHLEGAWLKGAYLEGANLMKAHLEGAHLEGAYLQGAWLMETHLERAWLEGIHLERAWLEEAYLEEVHLEGAHLEGAWLKGAHLEGANLMKAHLEGARLEEAKLQGAWLQATDLCNVKGLSCKQLLQARDWQQAYRDPALACGAPIPAPPNENSG